MQKAAADLAAWHRQCQANGTLSRGGPLEPTGKIVSGKGGKIVSDGPFAESKEVIGGYVMLTVHSMEEAVAIAQQCPGLIFGGHIEVRPVMDKCPMTSCDPAA